MIAEIFGIERVIVVIVVVAVLFGGTQIPKLARSLGSAQSEFKKGLSEGAKGDKDKDKDKDKATEETSAAKDERHAAALRAKHSILPRHPGSWRWPTPHGPCRVRSLSSSIKPSNTCAPPRWWSCPSICATAPSWSSRRCAWRSARSRHGARWGLRVCARPGCTPSSTACWPSPSPPRRSSPPCVPASTGTVVVEVVAVGLVRVSTLTRYVRVAAVPVDDADSALTSGAAGADARRFGPALARGLGYATGRTAERLPDAEAALRRSARHVSARWPGAEAALRRGTRRAVRHAARLARARRDNTT